MNKNVKAPMLIGLLALALILVACDRPSATNPLSQNVSGEPTLDQAAISAQQTADAAGQDNSNQSNAPSTTATETPIPPAQPEATQAAQPTPVPAQPQATATPAQTQPTATPGSTSTTCTSPYVVQPGDRLFSIGRACNVNPYAIAQANRIGAPYFIYPGQQLTIPSGGGTQPPPSTGGNKYVVQPGDNLFRISLMFGRSMQAIAAANGIGNYNVIFVGQILTIP